MSITIEAIYENGVLKPSEPLPLKEHEQVRLTVHPKGGLSQQTYGLLNWKGTHEELQQILAQAEEAEDNS